MITMPGDESRLCQTLEAMLNERKNMFTEEALNTLKTFSETCRISLSHCLNDLQNIVNISKTEPISNMLEDMDFIQRLVTNLLLMVRIEAGDLTIRRESVNITEVIQGIAKDFQMMPNRRPVQIELSLADDPIMVHADLELVTRIFNNLIEYAVSNRNGEDRITLQLSEKNDRIECEIKFVGKRRNTGDIPRMPSNFQESGNMHGIEIHGTGLDIIVAKGLIQKHGGRIWAESGSDGATLKFTLERIPIPKILIVEDESAIIDLVEKILSDAGYPITVATNGNQAIERAFGDIPSLILLDLVLLGMNGYEVIDRLKQDSRTRTIPILIGSAFPVDSGWLEKVQDDTPIHVITKPYDVDELKTKVEDLLQN